MRMTRQELFFIKGGSITASMIEAVFNGLQKIFDFGRTLGSAISRLYTKKWC